MIILDGVHYQRQEHHNAERNDKNIPSTPATANGLTTIWRNPDHGKFLLRFRGFGRCSLSALEAPRMHPGRRALKAETTSILGRRGRHRNPVNPGIRQ